MTSKLDLALERFYATTDLDAVHERIKLVRESSVSGYRGARPRPRPTTKSSAASARCPKRPPSATLIAVDGSQIYPDPHAAALYYLINIGVFVYYYGEPRLPYQFTEPQLYYSEAMLQDRDGRLITNQTVNARRSVMEMQWLAKEAWNRRDEPRPLIGFHDGGLLKFFGATDVAGAQQIENDYLDALRMLLRLRRDPARAIWIKPRSTYLISLLHLLSLDPGQVNDANLRSNGDLEGLTDDMLFAHVLEAGRALGHHDAEFAAEPHLQGQTTPQISKSPSSTSTSRTASNPTIARIDIPMWVARDKDGGRRAARADRGAVFDSGAQALPVCAHPRGRTGLRQQRREKPA